jgi:hypothetical protein
MILPALRFDSLYLMSTAIRSSFGILGWTAALLFLIQMLFALACSSISKPHVERASHMSILSSKTAKVH